MQQWCTMLLLTSVPTCIALSVHVCKQHPNLHRASPQEARSHHLQTSGPTSRPLDKAPGASLTLVLSASLLEPPPATADHITAIPSPTEHTWVIKGERREELQVGNLSKERDFFLQRRLLVRIEKEGEERLVDERTKKGESF